MAISASPARDSEAQNFVPAASGRGRCADTFATILPASNSHARVGSRKNAQVGFVWVNAIHPRRLAPHKNARITVLYLLAFRYRSKRVIGKSI